MAQRLGEEGFRRIGTLFNEETAQAAFLPVIEAAVRDFHGYAPAVKTLTKIYRLWLDHAVRGPVRPALALRWTAVSTQKAARLAKRGLRRTATLGRHVLALLGLRGAADHGYMVPAPESGAATAPSRVN